MQSKVYLTIFVVLLAVAPQDGAAVADAPWRAEQALALPSWLSLSGTHRTRYETLDPQFRPTRSGSDQVLVLRTTLMAGVHQGPFTFAAEMMDSRSELDDSGTLINTGIVNAFELLQGYLQWQGTDLFSPGSTSDVRIGRITMDIGSRRFVARNRYRNTINAFTGIDWQWQGASGRKLRAFYTLPVHRLPNRPAQLRDNEVEFDEEGSAVKFWGLYYADTLSWGDRGELFYFGIDEDDSSGRPTRNRDLTTLGFRVYRTPQLSQFDYQVESAFQFGESRSSALPTNVTDLDHFGHFHHGELGYTFDYAWRPRLIAQYDFASGDHDPDDGDYERLTTLYGARRFDFGPTGIYGPFARANLNTPGLRLQLKPRHDITSFIAYRGYWLASDRDAWTTTGLRDRNGDSGDFIGQQIEIRLRWNVRPNNVRVEAGFAHLFAGEFMDDAPNTLGQGDVTYLYSQLALTF